MTEKRSVAVVSVGRSDFGLYEPLLRRIQNHPHLSLRFMPTAAHHVPLFGGGVAGIEAQGFSCESGLEMSLSGTSAAAMAKSLGIGVSAFAQAFAADQPDFLVVLGDRLEMLCAPIAAMAFNFPVVHIHGGKVTEGALDERVRHAITKMSHLHFVSCDEYAKRVLQLGEESWRVCKSGAMGLGHLRTYVRSSREALYKLLNFDLQRPFLLVTFHPVTLEGNNTDHYVQNLLEALDQQKNYQIVITYPNADAGHDGIISHLESFRQSNSRRVHLLQSAGSQLYMDLMSWASAMIGNSSSGIVEAPSFELPVVNIGSRQTGAVRALNVVDVGYSRMEILGGLERALSTEFRESLRGMANPYGDGRADERIVEVLTTIPIDDRLLRKKFIDFPDA